MKNSLIIAALTLASFSPMLAQAKGNGPCAEIRNACEGAGYAKGAHKTTGKGLMKDCMQKLKNGEAVEGVSVTPDQVAACKSNSAKNHLRKSKS